VPERAEKPWLAGIGLTVTGLLFALGVFATTRYQLKQDAFRASTAQLVTSGVLCIALIVAAFLLPRRKAASRSGAAPNSWLMGALGLVAGGAVLLVPSRWNWWAAVAIAAIDFAVFFAAWLWSRREGWSMYHKLALASGAAMAYGIHAFVETPVVPGPVVVTRIGNAMFFLGAVGLIVFAAKRTRGWLKSVGKASDVA
jgi:hypothetical protein